jgi:hypothetical protein
VPPARSRIRRRLRTRNVGEIVRNGLFDLDETATG